MGVYWATGGSKENWQDGWRSSICVVCIHWMKILIFESVRRHGKCLVLTEEQQNNSFAEALAGRISKACFTSLDAAVEVLGALDVPAIPMNMMLENEVLPNAVKVESMRCAIYLAQY